MAIDLAKLVAKLELQSSQFQSELEKSNKKLAKFAKSSSDSLLSIDRGAKALLGSIKTVAGGIAAALSVGALANSIKHTIQYGDELAKAAEKSGIAAKQFTALAYVAKQSDVDITALSAAIKKMQVSLSEAGSGSAQPIQALKALGLSIKDIKNLAPDKQFELLGDRISKLRDPADRTRAAVELFGKAGADLLPLFLQGADGIKKAKEEAEKMGLVFNEAQLQKFKDADDAIKRLKSSWDGVAASLTNAVVPALTKVLDLISGLLNGPQPDDPIKLLSEAQIVRANALESVARLQAQVDKEAAKIGRGGSPVLLRSMQSALEKSKKILAETEQRLNSLNDKIKVSSSSAVAVASETPPGFSPQDNGITAAQRRRLNEWLDEKIRLGEEVDRISAGMSQDIYKAQAMAALAEESVSNQEKIQKAATQSFKEMDKNAFKTLSTISVYAEQAARNMQDAFADFLFDPFSDGLKGMLKGFIDVLRRMVAEAAAAQIFGPKDKGGLGLGDLISSGISALFGGGRATGGPVSAGKVYRVNENEPEYFSPGTSGNVIPLSRMPAMAGGGISFSPVYNIDARGATMELAKALPGILQQSSDATIARMRDLKRRGRF